LGGFREGGCYSTKSTKIGETQSKTKGNYGDWGGGGNACFAPGSATVIHNLNKI